MPNLNDAYFAAWRGQMCEEITAHTSFVSEQIGKANLDERVIEVMGRVPRHEFVPAELKSYAYVDLPLPIGYGKTISQPFIIALMTDLLQLGSEDTVLEIGTGLGYHAAVMAEMVQKVYSMEIIEDLSAEAAKRLGALGYGNIDLRIGDGYHGWATHGPFDKILVTAAPDLVPPPLLSQLKPGGRMVIPAGIQDAQQLMLVEKDTSGRTEIHEILPVRFSPLESGD